MRIRTSIINAHLTKSIGWLRIFGKGIQYKDTSKHFRLFTERNGYVKTILIGKWQFKWLNSNRP